MATTRDMASYWLQALLLLSCLRLADACFYTCIYLYWYFWVVLVVVVSPIVAGVGYRVRKVMALHNAVRDATQEQMQVITVSNSMARPVALPLSLAASNMPPAYPGPPPPGNQKMPPAHDPACPPPPATYSAGSAGSQQSAN